MNTPSEEPIRNAQETREAELEQANGRLHEELTERRAERALAAEEEEQARQQTRTRPRRSSRRKMLTKGLGVTAVATVGAGALLELSSGTALASSVKPGVFASSTAGTPAVKATGTNGADGVDATSDSGTGVSATSGSGTGPVATSSSGLAGHFVGNVKLDNALTVVGTLSSGAGTFASSVSGTPSIKATGTNGADGVDATSDSGTGVSATSTSGTGLVATSSTGLAAHFVGGNVDMDKNLNVAGALSTGTLSSGAGALASSVGGTPAVKATGTNGASGVDASSDIGTGVSGTSVLGGIGVSGTSFSGFGVIGSSSSSGVGIQGESVTSDAVRGGSNSGSGIIGVSSSGNGVQGISSSTTFGVAGVHGQNSVAGALAGLFDGNVQVNGNFSATGTKAFVQAHPTDPSREIVYVALEGGEAGTYVRGTGQLQSGKAVLALPEHFALVTETSGLTIQLTPRGAWLQLYVVELDTAQLVVREAQGKSGRFDYFICGVRRGYEQHEVIRAKR